MASDLLEQILPHIEASIHPKILSIPDWKYKEHNTKESFTTAAHDYRGTLIRIPFEWGKNGKLTWFKQIIQIPEEFTGCAVAITVDLLHGLIWVNGKLQQTIHPQQQEILLTTSAQPNTQYAVSILAEPTSDASSLFAKAELVTVDIVARRLYNSLVMLREIEITLEPHSQELKDIQELIRRTLIFLKYFKPGSEEYPNAIKRAYNFLLKALETEYKASIPLTFHSTFYSAQISEQPLTLDQQLSFLKSNTFIFQNQGEIYPLSVASLGIRRFETLQALDSETLSRIKEMTQQKRLHLLADGYNFTDIHLYKNEGILRRLQYEQELFQHLFQQLPEYFFLSNRSICCSTLPQILKLFGYKGVLSPFPIIEDDKTYNIFQWKGLDRSTIPTIVTYLQSSIEPGSKDFLSQISILSEEHIDSAGTHLILLYNIENILPQHLDKISILKNMPGLPAIIQENIASCFDLSISSPELQNKCKELQTTKVSEGILRYPQMFLADIVHTEQSLLNTEIISALLFFATGSMPSNSKQVFNLLKKGWALLSHPDISSFTNETSSIEFYTTFRKNLQDIQKQSSDLQSSLFKQLVNKSSKKQKDILFTVVNTSSDERNDYITVELPIQAKNFIIKTSKNVPVETQLLATGDSKKTILCYAKNLKPFSIETFTVQPIEQEPKTKNHWNFSARTYETPWYTFRFDTKGMINSLYAKHLRKELLSKGKKFNLLSIAREIRKTDEERMQIKGGLQNIDFTLKSLKVIEAGPLRGIIRLEYRTQNQLSINITLTFYHDTPRIDIHYAFHCKERHIQISSNVMLNINAKECKYSVPYGIETQQILPQYNINVISRIFEINDSSTSICIMSKTPMNISYERSVLTIPLLHTQTIPRHGMDSDNDSTYYNIGDIEFSFSLIPLKGKKTNWEIFRTYDIYSTNLYTLPHALTSLVHQPLSINKPTIMLSSLRLLEEKNTILCRCFETEGNEQTDVVLKSDWQIKTAYEANPDGTTLKELVIKNNQIHLRFRPFEIKTLKLEFGKKKKTSKR